MNMIQIYFYTKKNSHYIVSYQVHNYIIGQNFLMSNR
jgi:hypothetical protein